MNQATPAIEHRGVGADTDTEGNLELAGKYLTFYLDKEEYGLQILMVREIIGMMPITPVPRTPETIRGVVNLRGKVIPVIELRTVFGMAETEETAETCIIVVQAQGAEMGVVVDRVSEVMDIAAKEIQDPPSFGQAVSADYLLGIGKSDEQVRLLLDIKRVLADVNTDGVAAATA